MDNYRELKIRCGSDLGHLQTFPLIRNLPKVGSHSSKPTLTSIISALSPHLQLSQQHVRDKFIASF